MKIIKISAVVGVLVVGVLLIGLVSCQAQTPTNTVTAKPSAVDLPHINGMAGVAMLDAQLGRPLSVEQQITLDLQEKLQNLKQSNSNKLAKLSQRVSAGKKSRFDLDKEKEAARAREEEIRDQIDASKRSVEKMLVAYNRRLGLEHEKIALIEKVSNGERAGLRLEEVTLAVKEEDSLDKQYARSLIAKQPVIARDKSHSPWSDYHDIKGTTTMP